MRILIAHSEREWRLRLSAALQGLGYEVVTANDGSDAERILSTDAELSGVLIAQYLEGTGGVELIRSIRHQQMLDKGMPVILLSTMNWCIEIEELASKYSFVIAEMKSLRGMHLREFLNRVFTFELIKSRTGESHQ